MSHQSGITANDELKEKFAQAKDGHLRVLGLVIENETLVVKTEENAEGTFDEDFDRIIPPLIQPKSPAFFFVRLDTISEISGHNWLLIVYIPDEAKVRERMLYASTIATLKREFGLTYITQEIRTSTPAEMTSQSFHQYMRSQAAPPPQRRDEEEMSEIRRLENNSDIGVHTKRQTLQGLMFPFDENVIEAFHLFKKQDVDYVQMEIDYEKELILLSHSEANLTPEQIQKILPENAGRYHIYRFKHEFNGESLSSVREFEKKVKDFSLIRNRCQTLVFLYSVPGHGNKIQLRMVYASCKESVIEAIDKKYGITIDRKLELSDASDLTSDHLFQQVHPEAVASATKSTFSKPKAPTRGPRRLVKTTD